MFSPGARATSKRIRPSRLTSFFFASGSASTSNATAFSSSGDDAGDSSRSVAKLAGPPSSVYAQRAVAFLLTRTTLTPDEAALMLSRLA